MRVRPLHMRIRERLGTSKQSLPAPKPTGLRWLEATDFKVAGGDLLEGPGTNAIV